MLNGHMDPGIEMTGWTVDPHGGLFEDGWIWGMGAHDDKGGIVAMISAVEAIVRADLRPKGDILVCPVVAHKYGGVGTRALLKSGIRADMCINLEHSANTIANVCVGLILVKIRTTSPDLFFRYSKEARSAYWNPIEQQCEIIRRLGPSLTPMSPSSWLTFTPHPDLPDFPKITIDTIHKDHYFHPKLSALTTRECEMTFQIRLVPGQTEVTVRADLERLLETIKSEHAAFSYEIFIPANGPGDTYCQMAMETPRTHPLVQALASGFERTTGHKPEIGGAGRIGNVGDGNILAEAGIPSVQFGPGDIRIYREWPTPDERVRLDDLMDAAGTVAIASWQISNSASAKPLV
jgi:acetylornithine deacetylase/succinyl-diaminopimelate desuccinylase-like protein